MLRLAVPQVHGGPPAVAVPAVLVERVNYLARLDPAVRVRYGLPDEEQIYLCHKGA